MILFYNMVKKKGKKIQKKRAKKAPVPQKQEKAPGKAAVFFKKYGPIIFMAASVALLFLSVLFTVKGSFLQKLNADFMYSMKMPLDKIYIFEKFDLKFTVYFLYNILTAAMFSVFILILFFKKAGRIKSAARAVFYTLYISFLAAIHLIVTGLFIADKLHVLQMILFTLEIVLTGALFLRKDIREKTDISLKGIVTGRELRNLVIFSVFVLLLYMFDYKSWKYSFIGDEYSFFNFANDIANGKVKLRIFSGMGVYAFNPYMSSIYQAFFLLAAGKGLFAWKLSSAIIVPLAVIPLYVWVKLVFNKRVAIIAVAAFALSKTMIAFGHIGYNNIHAVIFFGLTLALFEITIRKKSSFWAFLTVLALGFGCYTYYTSRLMIILIGMYWLFHPKRKNLSKFNIFAPLTVYAAMLLFLFISPDFMDNMLRRSAILSSEIKAVNERPFYLIMNYIHSFFMFIHAGRWTHFVTVSLVDMATAAGVIVSFIWMIAGFFKDWRARFLLLSYLILIFFVGALAQYKYPAITRMQFMVPLIAVMGAIGLSRIIALVSYFKKGFKAYRVLLFSAVGVIAALNFYSFYIFMPANYQFTMETYYVKFMQKYGKDKRCVLVGSKRHSIEKVAKHYGFENKFDWWEFNVFKEELEKDALRNRIFIIDAGYLSDRPRMRLLASSYIEDHTHRRNLLLIYDFTGPGSKAFYNGFMEMWRTGKTDFRHATPLVSVADREKRKSSPEKEKKKRRKKTNPRINKVPDARAPSVDEKYSEIKVSIGKTIVDKFPAPERPKNIKFTPIRDYAVDRLRIGVKLDTPTDMAMTKDAKRIFIADSGNEGIILLDMAEEGRYRLARKVDLYTGKKPFFFFFRKKENRGGRNLYICLNEDLSMMYLLDSRAGVISEYDMNGNFKKYVVASEKLIGATSIDALEGSLLLGVVNPGENMIIIMNIDGKVVSTYATSHGAAQGQLSYPCNLAFDKEDGYYIADTNGDRLQVILSKGVFRAQYPIGKFSIMLRPDIKILSRDGSLYAAVSQPFTKKLMFFGLKSKKASVIELSEVKEPEFVNPGPMEADRGNNIYLLDTSGRFVVKIQVPDLYLGR